MFAAFLSAFLIFTITQLQPNSTEISKDILLHISLQLSNSSVPAFAEPTFLISSSVAAVNILLFASLALVLIDAYLAMLTKSWLRDFDRSWRSSNVSEERARAREIRFQGLEQWKLSEVVAFLPLLIQASLVLFGVSLLIILFDLHRPTAYSTLVIFAAGICLYLCATVISALDTSAPFTSPLSRALQELIQRSRSSRVFSIVLLCFKWRCGRTTHENMDDAIVTWHKVVGAEIRLAISNRLYAATSKAVENLPVFTELLDQWVHTPNLRPQLIAEWDQVLPLIQPSLSNASVCKNLDPRSLARLFLCSTSKEFNKGRQAVIEALGKHTRDNVESPPADQLYVHLLHQPEPEWSLACRVVSKLDADSDTVIELRWILNWIPYQFSVQSKEVYLSWTLFMRNIIPFLRSTANFIMRNKLVKDDHGLFNLLLIITQLIPHRSKEVSATQTSANKSSGSKAGSSGISGGPFISIGDFVLPRENQWKFIRDLYATPSTSVAGFKRDFIMLVTLHTISALSAVEYSGVYDPFINPDNDLPAVMDALWETWKAQGADHYCLIGISIWILKRSSVIFDKPCPIEQQQRFQDLLDAYDSCTGSSIPLMTSNGLQFIEAALSVSLNAPDGDSKWEPQTFRLKNPWLVMHVSNILHHEWRIPRVKRLGAMRPSALMGEAVWGRLDRLDWRSRLKRFDTSKQFVGWRNQFDQLNQLDQLDRPDKRQWRMFRWLDVLDVLDVFGGFDELDVLSEFDRFGGLDMLDMLDMLRLPVLGRLDELNLRDMVELRDRLERLELRQCPRLVHWSPPALEIIARRRLDLYRDKSDVFCPDLVVLSLFLTPHNKDILNESHRLIWEFFKPTPCTHLLLPHHATKLEMGLTEKARKTFTDFFESKAIGDVTKWRLLASVVFPQWETLSTQWKDLIAAEVMKVEYQIEGGRNHRVDWMARVTPLLEGVFSLHEFGLANGDPDSGTESEICMYGHLTPTHLRMVATVVEHLGAERLTNRAVRELERFLGQYSDILYDKEALRRIQIVVYKFWML